MAKGIFRRFTKGFFLMLNLVFCVVYLIACLVPLLNPANWWFMGFLGLMLPYLALSLILWALFWWIVKPKLSLVSLFTLFLSYKQLGVMFALNAPAAFDVQRDSTALRIANWNIRSFVGINSKEKQRHVRDEVATAVLRLQPDVVCLQEFNHSSIRENGNNLALFTGSLPYYYFSRDFQRENGNYASGCVIFSKYPIIDSGKIKYPGEFAESLIYADVVKGKDTFRIYTTHLLSFRFNKTDYEGIDRIKDDPEKIAASKSTIRKMKYAFTGRGLQTRIVRNETDKSPYPSVICGDLNDVPNSYTYFTLRGIRKDAFLQTGLGIGKTYLSLAPTLRIDYILADRRFDVLQFDMIDEDLSDHLLMVTDLKLKNNIFVQNE